MLMKTIYILSLSATRTFKEWQSSRWAQVVLWLTTTRNGSITRILYWIRKSIVVWCVKQPQNTLSRSRFKSQKSTTTWQKQKNLWKKATISSKIRNTSKLTRYIKSLETSTLTTTRRISISFKSKYVKTLKALKLSNGRTCKSKSYSLFSMQVSSCKSIKKRSTSLRKALRLTIESLNSIT